MWWNEIIGFGSVAVIAVAAMIAHWLLGRSERAAIQQERRVAASTSVSNHEPQAR